MTYASFHLVMSYVTHQSLPRNLLSSAFLSSNIPDNFQRRMSSQQLAADPLSDDETELYK
jgi:hypothetical protein